MGLNLEEIRYLSYVARKINLKDSEIETQGLKVLEVARNFQRPKIDLLVKAQMLIYKHEFLTKALFCSLDFVKILQKVTIAYRGRPIATS